MPPFFGFHHVNAWEEPSLSSPVPSTRDSAVVKGASKASVIFELVTVQNISKAQPDPTAAFSLDYLANPTVRDAKKLITELRRVRLPIGGGTPEVEVLPLNEGAGRHDHGDLPTINPAYEASMDAHACVRAPTIHAALADSMAHPSAGRSALLCVLICASAARLATLERHGYRQEECVQRKRRRPHLAYPRTFSGRGVFCCGA